MENEYGGRGVKCSSTNQHMSHINWMGTLLFQIALFQDIKMNVSFGLIVPTIMLIIFHPRRQLFVYRCLLESPSFHDGSMLSSHVAFSPPPGICKNPPPQCWKQGGGGLISTSSNSKWQCCTYNSWWHLRGMFPFALLSPLCQNGLWCLQRKKFSWTLWIFDFWHPLCTVWIVQIQQYAIQSRESVLKAGFWKSYRARYRIQTA